MIFEDFLAGYSVKMGLNDSLFDFWLVIFIISFKMKPKPLSEYQQEREDEIYNMRAQQIIKRYKQGTKAIVVFTIFCFCLAIYRHLITKNYAQEGQFYRNIHSSKFGNVSQLAEKEKEGSLIVNNQQLGHLSWTILQLSTARFPEQFGPQVIDRFNTFLKLFGEFYPCKKCRQLYFSILEQNGLFVGQTRKQAMDYICQFHNNINKHMGKTTVDCSQVQKQWVNQQ